MPTPFDDWFSGRGWSLRNYQASVIERVRARQSSLVIAPTGAGKTLAGFLPSLIELHDARTSGLHTLYISPLKALTHDIERNLNVPVREMGLEIRVESRTGDTSSYRRRRQRERPPEILLTTPESLMLMLSYAEAPRIFGSLRTVVVDEVHGFAASKRGDLLALALSQLRNLAPDHVRLGLSATVGEPDSLAN